MDSRPSRNRTRLVGYDYATPGAYFLTICTFRRLPLLSSVRVGPGLAPATVQLSALGLIAQHCLLELPHRYPTIRIDHYVIMPNHIHLLLSVKKASADQPRVSVSDAMRVFKSLTTRACKQHIQLKAVFQRSFHDRILRGQGDYDAAWEYIDNNPTRWEQDHLYIK